MPLGEDSVKLFQKGLTTLIEVSGLRDDIDLHAYLTNASVGDVFVHKNCRKKYTDKRAASEKNEECQGQEPATKKLRSSLPQFDYKRNVLFAAKLLLMTLSIATEILSLKSEQ
jgi:hypothetical protein